MNRVSSALVRLQQETESQAEIIAALRAEVEQLRVDADRYKVVRRMHVEQFARIFKRNITENIPFDDLIDVWRKESA